MKFSYLWLKELTKFKESPQKLAEFLTLRVFEVGSVEKRGRDWALDVKILPNRVADASGHLGLAREIAALKNSKFQVPSSKLVESKTERATDFLTVRIGSPADCPRYTARVMTGVKVGPSPKWLCERLETCGLQAINNIVDAANYVMLETGQPLHVFDSETLRTEGSRAREIPIPTSQFQNTFQAPSSRPPAPKTIIVRRARKGEALLALDEKTYHLSPDTLVIADEVGPVALAGIKGGKDSGISAKTSTIVLEAANFDPVRIRRDSRILNLKTDASYRFEHGLDPNQTAPAIDRLAALIRELAGGEILSGRVDAYPVPLRPARILLRTDYAARLIGGAIPPAFYEATFRRLTWGFRRAKAYQAKLGTRLGVPSLAWYVEPSSERRDIQIEEDIIEEIVRLWGYEKIKPKPPTAPLAPAEPNEERQWESRVRDFLVGAGFTETYVYEFIGEGTLRDFGDSPEGLIEVENPTNPDTRYLATRPLYRYAKAVAENLRRFDSVGIFGIAKGFRPAARPSAKVPTEERKYLVVAKAKKETPRLRSGQAPSGETFYEAKGVVDRLLESLGIPDHWYDDQIESRISNLEFRIYHPYRRTEIKVGSGKIGNLGELHPEITERLKARGRIALAELDFDQLWRLARAETEYRPVPKFPAVIRDIALIVPADTKTEQALNVIENAGGPLLEDTDLFDYFQDEALGERGEKSLAFHLVFRSPERTLTDAEVRRLYRKIAAAAKARGWEIR